MCVDRGWIQRKKESKNRPAVQKSIPIIMSKISITRPPFFLFLPMSLGQFPILFATMYHPRIHTSSVFCHNPRPIKRRISLRSTKHSQKISSPIAMREWVRRWWTGDKRFVCLISDLFNSSYIEEQQPHMIR